MIEELLEALEALDFDEKILAKIANIDEDDLGLYLRKNKKKFNKEAWCAVSDCGFAQEEIIDLYYED